MNRFRLLLLVFFGIGLVLVLSFLGKQKEINFGANQNNQLAIPSNKLSFNLTGDLATKLLNLANTAQPQVDPNKGPFNEKEFLGQYNNYLENQIQSVAENQNPLKLTRFFAGQIKLSSRTDALLIDDYLKQLSEIENRYLTPVFAEKVKTSLSADNPDSFLQISKTYSGLVSDLQTIETPPTWVDLHKKLLVEYINASEIFNILGNSKDDPVSGMLASLEFQKLTKSYYALLNEMINKARGLN